MEMNQAKSGNDGSLDSTMMIDELNQREQISALADGQLQEDEWRDAVSFACGDEGRSTWELYHLVGDVLRSSELARPANPDFMTRLREQMAQEFISPRPAEPLVTVVAPPGLEQAANASIFRWKMVAGVASLAAVAAIGWTSLATLQGPGQMLGGQLASAPARSAVPAAPVVAVVDSDGQQVMLRDPRLDELLAAHKQFGSTSALQMPAGFLRNATFESPGR
jgi:sigma-E factor negative regulatory protein RseA